MVRKPLPFLFDVSFLPYLFSILLFGPPSSVLRSLDAELCTLQLHPGPDPALGRHPSTVYPTEMYLGEYFAFAPYGSSDTTLPYVAFEARMTRHPSMREVYSVSTFSRKTPWNAPGARSAGRLSWRVCCASGETCAALKSR